MKIYLAGPMRGIDLLNFPAFDAAAKKLRDAGHEVFNPADHDRAEGFNPETDQPKPLKHYMKEDLRQVCMSDAVAVLPGWEKSQGATLEVHVARVCGIMVIDANTLEEIQDEHYEEPTIEDYRNAALKAEEAITSFVRQGAECERRIKNEDAKLTNPKDAIGSSKLPMHLWPEIATMHGCLAFLDGMLKYGRANFRDAGVRASIYVDAARRHLADYFEGSDVDPTSGLHPLAHVLACVAILLDAEAQGKLNDDRQFNAIGANFRSKMNELTTHVSRLKREHSEAGHDPKHWTIADNRIDPDNDN